jgi:hypothetical protein
MDIIQQQLESNPYLHLLQSIDPTPCVLCGSWNTVRWCNSLLQTSNPQCADEVECLARRGAEGF